LGWALDVAAAVLPAYEALLGVPYPLPKLDLAALPDFAAGAMENWGLVVYRETALLAGNASGIQQRREVALTIAHELAHMVGFLSALVAALAQAVKTAITRRREGAPAIVRSVGHPVCRRKFKHKELRREVAWTVDLACLGKPLQLWVHKKGILLKLTSTQ